LAGSALGCLCNGAFASSIAENAQPKTSLRLSPIFFDPQADEKLRTVVHDLVGHRLEGPIN
jgi:hypothetical protein